MMSRLLFAPLLLLAASPAFAARHDVTLAGQSFTPRTLTIEVGDTVHWHNNGGTHNVVADDGSFTSGSPSSAAFDFEHTFTSAGDFGYFCSVHGGPGGTGMSGTITVQAAEPTPPALTPGSHGSWYNPATNGQGFFVEVSTDPQVFVFAWFTWLDTPDPDGLAYDWMTGSGPYDGNVATLTVARSRGGQFNDPDSPVVTTAAGSATFTLNDCSHATFAYELTDPVRSGSIELTKILPPGAGCVDDSTGAR